MFRRWDIEIYHINIVWHLNERLVKDGQRLNDDRFGLRKKAETISGLWEGHRVAKGVGRSGMNNSLSRFALLDIVLVESDASSTSKI